MLQARRLGSTGPETSPIGLGCMALSGVYGPADRDEAVATVRAANDKGITLLAGPAAGPAPAMPVLRRPHGRH